MVRLIITSTSVDKKIYPYLTLYDAPYRSAILKRKPRDPSRSDAIESPGPWPLAALIFDSTPDYADTSILFLKLLLGPELRDFRTVTLMKVLHY